MAAAPWTVRVRGRVVEAERRSRHASGILRNALPVLAWPMHVADVPGARARAQSLVAALDDASSGLAFTAATAAAAELLALRGAAADPTAPLPSVADIPDAHPNVRAALNSLREARVNAEAACVNVGRCVGPLLTAYGLLEHPGVPGVDGLIDTARTAAHAYLVVAEDLARVSATNAHAARLLL